MTIQHSLAGEVALVTGASHGIGRAIALMLAREGCAVALVGRDAGALDDVAEQCATFGAAALPIQADLRETGGLRGVVEQCMARFGQLNMLINNAGVFDWASVMDADLGAWDTLLDVNLRAAMHLTHHAVPQIIKHRRGAIVFIASMAGKTAFGTNAAYVASKHGMVGFSGSIFEDVRAHNVKVCAICPGFVNAGASREMDAPPEQFEQFIQPEDVARAVQFVVTSPDTSCPTEIIIQPQRRFATS